MVDQRASCGSARSGGIVQTAPLALAHGEPVELAVHVDGYMLEVFANNRTVITALLPHCVFAPPTVEADGRQARPAAFKTALHNSPGSLSVKCVAESWQLAL